MHYTCETWMNQNGSPTTQGKTHPKNLFTIRVAWPDPSLSMCVNCMCTYVVIAMSAPIAITGSRLAPLLMVLCPSYTLVILMSSRLLLHVCISVSTQPIHTCSNQLYMM